MITIIAAVSVDGFIGKDDTIPWKLPSDMGHFKSVTLGHTVVMGRKTWDSLEKFRPLPDRRNIVLSRQADFRVDGAEVVRSLTEALELTNNDEQVFIMGGGQIYQQAMSIAERLLITQVQKEVGKGDTRFPHINPQLWNLISRTPGVRIEKDECGFIIEDYSPNLRYIELANVRGIKMLQEYRLIRQRDHCPFCPEQLPIYHNNPIIWEGDHWVVSKNDYPYAGTSSHIILIPREHVENVGSLSKNAWQEFQGMIRILEASHQFPGGGVCMRQGNPLVSGASIKHLHAHAISPEKGNGAVPFLMGTGKR